MIPAPDVSLRVLRDADHPKGSRSEVVIGGRGTGEAMTGCVLEGAWRPASGGVLVAATCDCPFEELVTFLWLREGRRRAEARLGVIYTAGLFELIEAQGDALRFAFFGKDRWVLRARDVRWPRRALTLEEEGA